MVGRKRGVSFVMGMLVGLIIAVVVLVIMFIAYGIITGDLFSIGDFLGRFLRFGRG